MSNFKYLNTDFNQIFANNTADFSCNQIVGPYTTTTDKINTKYNATNGSKTQQNNIKYSYDKDNISTNFSLGIQAFYIEYFYNSSNNQTITIPNFCTEIRCFLVGAGGSGGAGGGDKEGYSGTDGAGGGGGGYEYKEISVTPNSTATLYVGKGGASVSGGSGDGNNGMPGKSGEDTTITYIGITYTGKHGVGGDGGHPSSSATVSTGATGNIKNGSNSNGTTGGLSGYSNFITANDFNTYFKPYSSMLTTYGNGGNATNGAHDPNSNSTGVGIDGYARIYFMAKS